MTTPKKYCLKIELRHTHVKIRREVVVPEDIPLSFLSDVIQDAMGWEHCHMHEYTTADKRRIGEPQDDDDFWGDDDVENEYDILLNQIVSPEAKKFSYTYDFGDGWKHAITVKSFDYQKPIPQPCYCIKAEGACPPEDVGGPYGYAEFCEAIHDPNHESHDMFCEWIDGYDLNDLPWPDKVDLSKINELLLAYENSSEEDINENKDEK